ncbi:Hypothetical predicted protein [Olea europaea subsp. europaea]|uniref:Uncharacterized protein n=1 Tax=Olea europaea subsp. europaea TaxID=158383 RepID=A0A8S0PRH1_OLEEU|nr:Hypothetical predicted protein [Olea europaea subsp. europaea]
MVYRPCPGRIQAAARTSLNFRAFLRNFWDSVSRPCPGCIMAKAGTEPNFQAILGNFMDTVCRPCPGYGRDASRLLGSFRDMERRGCPGRSLSFRHFSSISGSRRTGHVRDTFGPWWGHSLFLGISRQFVGTVCRPSPGRILAAVETRLDFQAFLGLVPMHGSGDGDAEEKVPAL